MAVMRPMLFSSNRTCRFPASGSRSNCRRQALAGQNGGDLQINQSETVELLIVSHSFRWAEGPLTAPLEMLRQAVTHIRVDLPKRVTRITEAKVVSPAIQMSIQILNQHRDGIAVTPTTVQLSQAWPAPVRGPS